MKSLHLINTLSRKKERFRSNEEGLVKVFTCGPSVYRRAHIGNYRTFLYEDVLHRYLEYLGYRVQRVMNYPKELMAMGHTPEDIRFSLIYPHYRKRINLTGSYIDNTTGKLGAFREAAKRLTGLAAEPESPGGPAEELFSGAENAFRERMNDDLDVEGAFEKVYAVLSRLLSMRPDGNLGYAASSSLR